MNDKEINDIKQLIGVMANELHRIIGAAIDTYMVANKLPEDNLTLNIVFQALSYNLQAIVEQNNDIPADSVEYMIDAISRRLRKAVQSRLN